MKNISKKKLYSLIYSSMFEHYDEGMIEPPEHWLDTIYGLKIYLDDNFQIQDYVITDEKKFLMFILKWS